MPHCPLEIINRLLIEGKCRGQHEAQLKIYSIHECWRITETLEVLSFTRISMNSLCLSFFVSVFPCHLLLVHTLLTPNRKLALIFLVVYSFLWWLILLTCHFCVCVFAVCLTCFPQFQFYVSHSYKLSSFILSSCFCKKRKKHIKEHIFASEQH